MKDSPIPSRRTPGRKIPSAGITHLPMEWMDPMSWRLPSGKALAEFALQAGFLAPLILNGPRLKERKKMTLSSDTPAKLAGNLVAGVRRCRIIPARFAGKNEHTSVDRDRGGSGGDGG